MFKVKIKCTPENYVSQYLTLWKGIANLTDTEVVVLTAIVSKYLELKQELKEPYLSKFLFSPEVRREMYSSLDYTPQRFNNYIKYLKDKGVIQGEEGDYILNKKLIPTPEVTFEFNPQ